MGSAFSSALGRGTSYAKAKAELVFHVLFDRISSRDDLASCPIGLAQCGMDGWRSTERGAGFEIE